MACCQGIARKLQKGLKAPGWCGSLKLIALPLPVREGFRDKLWYDCGIERLAKPYSQTVQFRFVPFCGQPSEQRFGGAAGGAVTSPTPSSLTSVRAFYGT